MAAKAIEIWPNILNVIKCLKDLPPSKQLKHSKSYDTLPNHFEAKLKLFRHLAHMLVRTWLIQTDSHFMPFLSSSVEVKIFCIVKMFISNKVLEEAVSAY